MAAQYNIEAPKNKRKFTVLYNATLQRYEVEDIDLYGTPNELHNRVYDTVQDAEGAVAQWDNGEEVTKGRV